MVQKRQHRASESDHHVAADEVAGRRASPSGRRRRRGLRVLLLLLGFAVSVVVCGPQFVRIAAVRTWLLHRIVADLPGQFRCDRVSLGWLQPITIEQIHIDNSDDAPLVRVQRVRTELPLWRLVRSPLQIGVVYVEDVELWLKVRPGGSSWEDFLHGLPSADASSTSTPQIQIQLRDGTLHVDDSEGSPQTLTHLQAWLDVPGTATQPWTFAARCTVPAAVNVPAGQLQLQGSVLAAAAAEVVIQGQLESMPLDLTRYVAHRYQQDRFACGEVSGQMHVRLQPAEAWPISELDCSLSCHSLEVATSHPNSEHLQLSDASLEMQTSYSAGEIAIRSCQLTSPLMSLTAEGHLNLPTPTNTPFDLMQLIRDRKFQLSGQLDLATVGRQLPQAIHLRDDVHLASGLIRWDVAQQPDAKGFARLTGQIEAEDLAALHGDETLRLPEPVRLRFARASTRLDPLPKNSRSRPRL